MINQSSVGEGDGGREGCDSGLLAHEGVPKKEEAE